MKKHVALCLIIGSSLLGFSQGVQKLEKLGSMNAYTWYPVGYDTAKVKKFPVLVFFPGEGETGTDASKLMTYGPASFIRDGLLKPDMMVVSIQPTTQWPDENTVNTALTAIKKAYKVDTSQIHLTGISSGGNAVERFGLTPALAKTVRSIIPVAATEASALWGNAVTVAKMRLRWLFLVGNSDPQKDKQQQLHARIGWTDRTKTIFETPNNNGHCCFNEFYNPTFKVPGTDVNIYQWAQYGEMGPVQPPIGDHTICITPKSPIQNIVVLFKDGTYKILDSSYKYQPEIIFNIP